MLSGPCRERFLREPSRVGDLRTLSYDEPTSHRERAPLIGGVELKQARSITGCCCDPSRVTSTSALTASMTSTARKLLRPPAGKTSWDYFAGERQYSEEVNLISPVEGRFDWILGAYFQRNEIEVTIHSLEGRLPH